ncbi:MAG: branched-chain amino acid aminotransferase [Rhodospirillaceae bacterium]|nr:branched-chain amino acid aminotransferase [Rhodospirillales bacterium]
MAGVIPFDDRDGFIWFDGELAPWRDAKIHVLTHGLHYGSCVFEGERVYGGKVFKLAEHTERLLVSGDILGMKIPYSAAEIDAAIMATVKANGIVDGYVRPFAWRGSEMMGVAAQSSKIHLAVAVWSWPSYWSPEARMRGIRLNISQWRRPHPDTAPVAAKAAGLYMICTMSKHKAEGDGFEDSLMLDYRGQVAEATGANIFFVFDGELHTPLADCFLNGITRQTVIAIAKKRGLKVVERAIFPEELTKATECFLSGTAAEVTPVREIGPYTFLPGEISKMLINDYDALVRS